MRREKALAYTLSSYAVTLKYSGHGVMPSASRRGPYTHPFYAVTLKYSGRGERMPSASRNLNMLTVGYGYEPIM